MGALDVVGTSLIMLVVACTMGVVACVVAIVLVMSTRAIGQLWGVFCDLAAMLWGKLRARNAAP